MLQDYKAFIKELFTLDVQTIERYVKDGRIFYGECNQEDPQYYPPESDVEFHPGYYRATFLNLNHYDDHEGRNRYTDKLAELLRAAQSDMVLLSKEQIANVVGQAKEKHERLTNLIRKAMAFEKAYNAGTLDDPLFLELQLLNHFNIQNRPEASLDKRFAHNLHMVIAYKRGVLTSFIEAFDQEGFSTSTPPPKEVEQPSSEKDFEQNLTQREIVLIHCYQQKPAIKPGEKGYQDYMAFARPTDRISHPNDSKRKANSLIRSIEKILPHLDEKQSQQANNEIVTIRSKFHN